MSNKTVSVGDLANAVNEALSEYARASTDGVKKAVRDAGKTVKEDIKGSAPVRTGRYAKSWSTKVLRENSESLELVVYSPTRYMLAHLLEHGHAKRGGGRVAGKPHIKPAEEHGIDQLQSDIERVLRG